MYFLCPHSSKLMILTKLELKYSFILNQGGSAFNFQDYIFSGLFIEDWFCKKIIFIF